MFSNEYNGDGGGGFTSMSFAKLEKKAAQETGVMFDSVQDKLYDAPIHIEPPALAPAPVDTDMMGLGFHNDINAFRRFAANEYEAHTDAILPKELKDWQQAFPYLRLNGTKITKTNIGNDNDNENENDMVASDEMMVVSPSLSHSHFTEQDAIIASVPTSNVIITGASTAMELCDNNNNNDDNGDSSDIQNSQALSLSIRGKGYQLPLNLPLNSSENEVGGINGCNANEEEEILAQNGIYEEVLEVNHEDRNSRSTASSSSPSSSSAAAAAAAMSSLADSTNCSIPLSPLVNQKEEILSILMDGIWPDLCSVMEPLVRSVVEESRKVGLVYNEENTETTSTTTNVENGVECRSPSSVDGGWDANGDGQSLFDHGW